jgi:hypothetical protein
MASASNYNAALEYLDEITNIIDNKKIAYQDFKMLIKTYVNKMESFNETKKGSLYNINKYGSINASD